MSKAIEMIEYIGSTPDRDGRYNRILSLLEKPYIIEANNQSRNIIIPAREQSARVALTAHTDAYPGSRGYNDNASGVVTLLRLQKELPDNFEIVLTDNEELAGRGSALYLSNGNKPKANINLDVVGLGSRIFYEKYGDFDLTMPKLGATEHNGVPFNDSHIFRGHNVPSILFITGTREKDLIREIWSAQHGMENDNRLELISEDALDNTYAYLKAMIALNAVKAGAGCRGNAEDRTT
jgi:hypothetical protein